MPDELKTIAAAVRDERTRICSSLVKVRHALLGKANAQHGNGIPAAEAYEDAATMISDFLLRELNAETNDG